MLLNSKYKKIAKSHGQGAICELSKFLCLEILEDNEVVSEVVGLVLAGFR